MSEQVWKTPMEWVLESRDQAARDYAHRAAGHGTPRVMVERPIEDSDGHDYTEERADQRGPVWARFGEDGQ